VFLGQGTAEPGILEESRALAQTFQTKGVRVLTAEVSGQGHVWPVWREVFGAFAQKVFQP
jgi:enterochelin esterase-like enzyme